MRRLLGFVVAASLGAAGCPATAAPAVRTLTVRGVPNTYAELTFPSRVRFETSTQAPPSYAARGSYAGVYVEPVRGAGAVAGSILLRGMPGLSDVPFPLAPSGWLPAGRYRVHLLGDAETTVRVRVEGLRRDAAAYTTRRSDVTATWVRRGVAGVATPADRTIVPFTVRPDTLVVVAATHQSTGFYGRRDVCVRKRTDGLSPCLDGNSGRGWYWGVYPVTWTLGGASAYHPGELPVGEMEAEFLDLAVAAPEDMPTFVLTLH